MQQMRKCACVTQEESQANCLCNYGVSLCRLPFPGGLLCTCHLRLFKSYSNKKMATAPRRDQEKRYRQDELPARYPSMYHILL